MKKGVYKFAGQIVEILSNYSEVHKFCEDYESTEKPNFKIITTQEEINYEQSLYDEAFLRKIKRFHKNIDSYLEIYVAGRLLTNKLLNYDTIMFHCSSLKMNDDGYLFTAPSGTGKSTHAQLWKKLYGDKVTIINDDKPFIKITDTNAIVYGSPWCGKEQRHSNISAKIKGICILERSLKNFIIPISPHEGFPILYRESFQFYDKKAKLKEMSIIDKLSKNIKIYKLGCNISFDAVELAHNTMNGGHDN